ncbi:MAG: hypothetical protein WC962_09695 [Phycisphaerae bacterium]|jgi:hypothetical protein
MQHIDIVVPTKRDEVHYITPLGCVHLEARLHHKRIFEELINSRHKLPNHHFIGLGDTVNAISVNDLKRFTAHETNRVIVNRTDYYNALSDYLIQSFEPIIDQLDVLMIGNHEWKPTQNSGIEPISEVIGRMKERGGHCRWGGYCMMLTYHFVNTEDTNHHRTEKVSILAAHGNWGGQGKGIIQTVKWAASMPYHDLCLTAHSHSMVIHPEPKMEQTAPRWRDGQVLQRENVDRTIWFVNAGTFLRGYNKHDELPDYGERAGHPIRYIGAPLIMVKPVFGHGIKVDVIGSTETGVIK